MNSGRCRCKGYIFHSLQSISIKSVSQIQKLFTHSYVSLSTIRCSARSTSWIVPSHRLHLKPSATRDKSPRTPLHRLTNLKSEINLILAIQTVVDDLDHLIYEITPSYPEAHPLSRCLCCYAISFQT